MLFTGRHETLYRFDRPVFLEPHLIRLTPRSDAAQRLLDFAADIEPKPAGMNLVNEPQGHAAIRVWFDGLHETLVIRTRFAARTLRDNPFDFLLEPQAQRLPMPRSQEWAQAALLAPFLGATEAGLAPVPGPAAAALAADLLERTGGDTLSFLNALNADLHRLVRVEPRQEPGVLPSCRTLAEGRGACRDLSVVFVEACRAVGIPAACVSGYQAGDPGQIERDLHAWAEAYLPGAGWRGFDPTLGLAVADAHLALCASPTPELTAPVQGCFRGTGAVAVLEHRIELDVRAG